MQIDNEMLKETGVKIEDYIQDFRCFSANDVYVDLWFKSIGLIFSQFSELVNKNEFSIEIENVESYASESNNLYFQCFSKYGSDKGFHAYHILYNWIFNQINVKNLLEIGLGTNNINLVSNMGSGGRPGASLRAFRELSTDTQIYGADIDRDILFNEDRISTFYVDQLDRESFKNLPKIKYDLIIDDGLHQIGANFNTLLWALENINDGGFIVIEDISTIIQWNTISYILKQNKSFDCHFIKCARSHVFLVKKNLIISEKISY